MTDTHTGVNHRIDCPTRATNDDQWQTYEHHDSIEPGAVLVVIRCKHCHRSAVYKTWPAQPKEPA